MFVNVSLEEILPLFDKLSEETPCLWGEMKAQRMVEHLTDTLRIACGENKQELLVPIEKLPTMIAFLESDKPMAKNIKVPFALPNTALIHEELALAIDEYVEVWMAFEELYETTKDLTHQHAYYGPLNFEQWKRLHSKHVTHHFTQFGLI